MGLESGYFPGRQGRATKRKGAIVEPWETSTLKGQTEEENPVRGAEDTDFGG